MKKRLTVIIILLAGAIISAFLLFKNIGNQSFSLEKNVPLYKDIDLDRLVLKENSAVFSLKGGEIKKNDNVVMSKTESEQVLQLALFYQWMKEDPLLYSKNIDLKEFERTIKILDSIQKEFLKNNNWGNNIFATGFLNSFYESTVKFRELENDISDKKAYELLESIKTSQEKI